MPDVLIRLHNLVDLAAAEKLAEEIRESGGINYTSTEGGDVNVTVGDVTVES